MQTLWNAGRLGRVVILVAALALGFAGLGRVLATEAAALPSSAWWLVVHDQCDDELHWISDAGEFTSIPRPQMPNEAPGAACSYRPMHISQDGRYLAATAALNNGRSAIGFFDLQSGNWLQVHQAQPDEMILLGERYSSDASNQLAVGFANEASAARAWRVILFDMTTGDALNELRSDGPEIAGFVGGEFLATADVQPHVLLLSAGANPGEVRVDVRFDALDGTGDPLGTVAWYPDGAPGVAQALISSPYVETDIDLLPDRRAIFAYNEPAFPAGPPVGVAPNIIDTNAVGVMLPTDANDLSPDPAIFYADGVNTLYGPKWAADGDVALFRLNDGTDERVHWVQMGTAVLVPVSQPVAQILGVPSGFVYNSGEDIYYQDTSAPSPTGPVFSDPMLSGSAAFVWASAFGDPALALTTPAVPASPPPGGSSPTPPPATGGPDLFVSEFSLNPATPVEGEPVQVRVGVYNRGDAAATGSFRIEWYPGEAYPSPACDWTLDGLVATGGRILTCNYSGYPSPYASINTLVRIDTGNVITETDEANNSYAEAISVSSPSAPATGQADLFVSEFSLDPVTPVEGEPVQVRVGVYNQGSAAATGTFRVEWYPGEAYASPGCDWMVDGLVASGGRILTCTYSGYPSPYGSINTLVRVDTGNVVTESNEANNSYSQAISVSSPAPAAQPDLFVSEFSLNPATPVEGESVQVRVGVYNQGSAAVSGTSFRIEWYPGENYPSPACDWTLDSMAASGGRILNCTYSGYPSPYGSINTLVKVDPTNTVAESNEGNNNYTQAISVSSPAPAAQPDLFVSEFSLNPSTPVKGEPVQVRVGVYNQGSAAVSGTNFRIEWYPGENYPSPACDWALDSMAAGGGRILNCTYSGYPSPYGSIGTLVKVDPTNTVAESNEGNNNYRQTISVSSP